MRRKKWARRAVTLSKLNGRFNRTAIERLEDRRLLAVDLKGFVSTLPTALVKLETGGLAKQIYNSDIPLVNDALETLVSSATDNATKFLSKFAGDITAPLNGLADNPTEADFLSSLTTTLDGFTISLTHAAGNPVTDNSVEYVLSFSRTQANALSVDVPLSSNLGLPGLGINLTTSGNMHLKLWFEANLQIGLTSSGDFYINTAAPVDELAIHASLSLDNNTELKGKIGFLQFDVHSADPTSITLNYKANLVDSDGKLHASEMPDGINFSSTISGVADIRLPQMTAKFSFDAGQIDFNPELTADFSLHWEFSGGLPTDGSISDLGSTAPTVSFDNVKFGVQSGFLDNLLKPALEKIHQFTGPLEPIVDELNSKPLDKYNFHETLLEMLNLPQDQQDFFKKVTLLVDLARNADSATSLLTLNLGSFGIKDVRQTGLEQFEGTPVEEDVLGQLAGPGGIPGVTDALNALNQDLPDTEGLRIPMLEHPSELFKFFLGNDTATLFQFTLPGLDHPSPFDPQNLATFEVPPFGPLLTVNVELDTGYEIKGNLTVGYDAHGLIEFLNDSNHEVSDLLDGFYVDTTKPLLQIFGLDKDGNQTDQILRLEINATGTIDAATIIQDVGVDVPGWLQTLINDATPVSGTVKVSIGMNLGGHLTVTLNAPKNSSNRFRLSDLGDDCIFGVEGEVDLTATSDFTATVKAQIPLVSEVGGFLNSVLHTKIVPTEVSKTWHKTLFKIGPEPVFAYNPTCVGDPAKTPVVADPKLAYIDPSDPNGVLRLNVGLYVGSFDANSRQIETSTIDESYTLKHVSGSPDDPGGETVDVTAFGQTQRYSGVKFIVAAAGDGDDYIDLGDTLSPSSLQGGKGKDTLKAGKGKAFIYGNEDDDTLVGGDGNDVISGDDGNDNIQGGGGDDQLFGGKGFNTISGGDGKDTLYENADVNWTLDGDVGQLTGDGYGTDDIADIDVVDVTGGISANTLTVRAWQGEVHLHGDGGNDQFFVELNGSGNSKYIIDDSNGDDTVTVRGTDQSDHITAQVGKITESGGEEVDYTDMEHAVVDGKAGQDLIDVRSVAANVPLEVDGGDDSDLIRVSSNAGIDDNGNLSQILGPLTIDAGGGGANRLIVSNYGGTTANPIILQAGSDGFSSIAGLTNSPIKYKATDGAFLGIPIDVDIPAGFYVGYDRDNGVIVRGSNTSGDQFQVKSTSVYTVTKTEGNGGDDTFNIGDGDLNTVQGKVNVSGGEGADHIFVEDAGNTLLVDYLVTPTSVTSFNSDDAPSTQVARTFGSLGYDGTSEFLRLDCTDAKNTIEVQPSLNTEFYIDGNLPAPGTVCPDDGDYLKLDTDGTTGRRISFTSRGTGQWTFTSPHKAVKFESIEKFNHVQWVAVGADVGPAGKSKPTVQVVDAETNEVLFTVPAALTYGVKDNYGVSVAMGDVDGDGIMDLVVAPGRNTAPDIKVFAGRPQPGVQGNLLTTISAANTFGKNYKNGVNVVVGDVTGDCMPEIILATALGAPTVKVFENDALSNGGNVKLTAAQSFNPWSDLKKYIGGATIAVGDLDGVLAPDGEMQGELIVGTGAGVAARWRSFALHTGVPQIIQTVMDPSKFVGGINVAAGDLNGDGIAEVITGAASNGGSWVRVYSASGSPLNSFQAFPAKTEVPNAAVHLTLRDLNDDGILELLTTQGQDGRSQYKVKKWNALAGRMVDTYLASSTDFAGGGLTLG